ncbi:MAG: TonB-dependent receptor, partial [Bacteroidota bacterium]
SSYVLTEDDLTVNIGVRLVYLNDIEMSESSFYIYPNIEATYRLVSDVAIGYGGITGDLTQNTYYDFADENPFVSPTLFITPTDQQFNAFLGIKGKLSNEIGYNIKASYINEDNKALYQLNPAVTLAERDYQFGNSFGVVYDDVTTLAIEGELNVDISRNFNLGLKAAYFNYDTSQQAEAWNLPDFTGSLFLDYQITEKWFAGASVFVVGERKDQLSVNGSFIEIPSETIVLDSFFDINAHLGYRINSKFSMFAKVNNLANQDYQRWANFPVQTLQFIAGATYQFDF